MREARELETSGKHQRGMMGTSAFLDKSIRELSKDTRQPEMSSFLI